MFLFTTPPEPPAIVQAAPASRPALPAGPVVDAIRQGAERTGADFGYLLSTARRESALDPAARAPTSSATGLFQFIEQTWLGMVKSEGDKVGLGHLAEAISPRSGGGFTVDDSGTRSEILKLREDPALASVMAGALTQQNRDALSATVGHEPNPGELYMAHVLGARGAADLIRSAQVTPTRSAALDLPDAAAANRSIFYERDGRARGSAEVYAHLSAGAAGAAAAPLPAKASPADTATAQAASMPAPAPFRPNGPVLYSLFQTENRPGPISDAIAKVWRTNNVTANATAVGYYPRAAASQLTAAESVALPAIPSAAPPQPELPAIGLAAAVPLPPPRPRDLAVASADPGRTAARMRQATIASR